MKQKENEWNEVATIKDFLKVGKQDDPTENSVSSILEQAVIRLIGQEKQVLL